MGINRGLKKEEIETGLETPIHAAYKKKSLA